MLAPSLARCKCPAAKCNAIGQPALGAGRAACPIFGPNANITPSRRPSCVLKHTAPLTRRVIYRGRFVTAAARHPIYDGNELLSQIPIPRLSSSEPNTQWAFHASYRVSDPGDTSHGPLRRIGTCRWTPKYLPIVSSSRATYKSAAHKQSAESIFTSFDAANTTVGGTEDLA